MQVFGDSKMVVDWVNRRIQINSPHLQQLLNVISRFLEQFTSFSIAHVYRELNSEADKLSKMALPLEPGKIETKVFVGNQM